MDYKILSIILVIALLVVVGAFIFVTYGGDILELFSGEDENADVGGMFSEPSNSVNPPSVPTS